jgi:hypothetical protein
MVDVVVAANFASFTHQCRSFSILAGEELTLDCRNASFYRRQLRQCEGGGIVGISDPGGPYAC